MRRIGHVAIATLLLSASPVALAQGGRGDQSAPGATGEPTRHADIEVQTSLSQTAIWLGNVATFTVSLTCRPGVDILQEDLGADKLTLDGLQVVDHSLTRRVTSDGRTQYEVVYGLTTFEPGSETLSIADWTVRYTAGPGAKGGSQPASDLQIPGEVLAWRSALPAAIKTLDVRNARAIDPAPRWWRATRQSGIALVAVSIGVFGWILFTRVSAGRVRRPRRTIQKESARDLQNTLSALRDMEVSRASDRLEAYARLEAAIRLYMTGVASVPVAALTPSEYRERLSMTPGSLAVDAIGRILGDCQDARYQPVERLPGEDRFRATLEAATEVFANPR